MASDDSIRGKDMGWRVVGTGMTITSKCARCGAITPCRQIKWAARMNFLCSNKCIPEVKKAREQRKQEAKA